MIVYAAGSVHDIHVDAADICGLTCAEAMLWFADSERERIVAVDLVTGQAAREFPAPGLRTGLATLHDRLVYAAGDRYQLMMIDINTGEQLVSARSPRPGTPITGMEGVADGLWLGFGSELELRSTADFRLLRRIAVPGLISGITATERYVAYADRAGESITLVDPLMEAVTIPVGVHGTPTGLAWDGARIWHGDSNYARLRAIDVPGIVPAI